jgi:hypothetical protein
MQSFAPRGNAGSQLLAAAYNPACTCEATAIEQRIASKESVVFREMDAELGKRDSRPWLFVAVL